MDSGLMHHSREQGRIGSFWIFICGITVLSLFSVQTAKAEVVPLVVVNGDTISTVNLDQQLMRTHRNLNPDKRREFDYRMLIDKLINDRLIIQEAVAIDMDTEDQVVEQVHQVQMREARKVYAREAFSYNSEISDKEIMEYFEKNYFKVKLRTLASRNCEEVAQYAEMIKNGVPMDSLAREVSLDTRRYLGGAQSLRYWFTVDDPTKALVKDLKVGDLSQPTLHNDACMIIRLDQRVAADTSELSQLAENIRQAIDKERRAAAWAGLKDSLSTKYSIKIDSTVLQDIQNDSMLVFKAEFLDGSDRALISAEGINGLSENKVRRKISHKAMNASDKSFREILTMTIAEITELMVLDAEAELRGTTSDPKVLDLMQRTTDSMLIEGYLQENVVSKIKFNHDEFEKYYDEHPDQFREKGEVRLYDLQVADEETAQIVMKRLQEGADFNYISNEFAVADGVAHDEDAWMKTDTYPAEISAQLDSLAVGEYTKPLRITTGWVIFKVRDRRPGAIKPLEDVDMNIREIMFQREFTRILDEVLAILKEHSDIEYFEKNIDAYFEAESDS